MLKDNTNVDLKIPFGCTGGVRLRHQTESENPGVSFQVGNRKDDVIRKKTRKSFEHKNRIPGKGTRQLMKDPHFRLTNRSE